jgi:hypothetical protein
MEISIYFVLDYLDFFFLELLWNNLISVFSRIFDDQSSGAESINGARGYLKHFQNFEFAFLTGVCNEIFNITDLFVFLFYNVNA